ncbi:iron dicitrate transport regulator FecR [Bordetella genomosp. 10]|uniref:Iron dicitrate transport regulator FecR n=1 Tax=Bordetella genomosp. 10 TaxID=1416804 RepID=A0A261SCE7_9BORD|nr:FecR domain-containing protein [Bordetella genomosp. 10]OZI34053.1 iron dicitrate transport regulator FecR [Bordetella genomosp. 10]
MADQVVNWLLLLRSGRASPADYADFMAWRASDPLHEKAWNQLTSALGSSFGRLSDYYPAGYTPPGQAQAAMGVRRSATVAAQLAAQTPLVPPKLARGALRRRLLTGGGALAAGIIGLGVVNELYPLKNLMADAATATGERRQYLLSDGSQILLDARTRVELDFAGPTRNVRLLEGAVTASVARDPGRPFYIHTEQGSVRSLGTRYMVRQQIRRSLVVVHEHEVEIVTNRQARATVAAGAGARFDDMQIDTPRAELMADAAWETGWIAVRNRPLADIVAALRPYRSGLLRVSMAAGGLLVTGQFPLDDSDATLDTLARTVPITIRRLPWLVSIDVLQT